MANGVCEAPDLTDVETHFRFGKNWLGYLRHVDEAAIREAENGLLQLLPPEPIKGATFIDIGCGSGLHALAAARLGAKVTAVDIDPDCTFATRQLSIRYDVCMVIREGSVFDLTGQFDIVYSWGVLHHTGAMWRAIEKASALVKPGGLFVIGLYSKTPFCGAWARIKRLYSGSPAPVQTLIRWPYTALLLLRLLGRNPIRYVREYKTKRGMNFHTDVHDWLGGYPYESAAPDEVVSFFDRLGFDVLIDRRKPQGIGLLGTGIDEFTFQKR